MTFLTKAIFLNYFIISSMSATSLIIELDNTTALSLVI